jgi:hypothetical protein
LSAAAQSFCSKPRGSLPLGFFVRFAAKDPS